MVKKKLRVAVLTQEDSFVIPENIRLIGQIEELQIVAVVRVDAAGSLINKKACLFKASVLSKF